jgi:hypothetical protein
MMSDFPPIDEESRRRAEKHFGQRPLLRVQYRGENFVAVCDVEDIDDDRVAVKPIALILTNEQMDHLVDKHGNRPRGGLSKLLAETKGDEDEA